MNDYTKPDSYGRNKMTVALNLSNYVTKADIKKQQLLIHQILLA